MTQETDVDVQAIRTLCEMTQRTEENDIDIVRSRNEADDSTVWVVVFARGAAADFVFEALNTQDLPDVTSALTTGKEMAEC